MIIFLLINLYILCSGLVESTEEVDTPQQTLPSPQNVGSGSNESSLDINNVDYSVFTVDIKSECCVHIITYRVRDGKRVTSVTYGQESLWKGVGEETLSSCTVYTYSHFGTTILEVEAGGTRKQEYFSGEGGRWYSIDEERFRERLKNLQDINYLLEHLTLDVSSPHSSDNVNVHRGISNGLELTHITVKSGGVTSVLDGERELWRAEKDGERCSEAWVHAMDGGAICRLNILHADNVIWTLYFENGHNGHSSDPNGSLWTSINRRDYMERHKAMLAPEYVRVDVAHIDPFMCNYAEYVEYDTLYTFGHPFSGYRVSGITLHDKLIWESNLEHCMHFGVVRIGSDHLFELGIGKANSDHSVKHYRLQNGMVTDTSRMKYYESVYGTRHEKTSTDVRVNIMGPIDPLQYTVYGYKRGKTTMYTFIPCPSIRVNFIFKDHMKIWGTENGNDRCLKVEYTHYYEGSSFIYFLTSGPSGFRHWYLQAIGQNGSFTRITREEYVTKLWST